MEADGNTIELAVQLGASALLVIVSTLVHGLGLIGIARLLGLRKERLEKHDFNLGAVFMMCGMALCLFLLHAVEIVIFAVFYLLVNAVHSFEEALHFSASSYATLGQAAVYFPDGWGLMGAIEALIGFLLIGWSTAFIVRNVDRLRS
jgi:large-conductance mechanosensitive channel